MRTLSVLLISLAVGSLFPLRAQEAPSSGANAIYLELLGSGGAYSLNFEKGVGERTALRLGFASWTSEGFFSDTKTSFLTFPVTVMRLPEGRGNGWEMGGGFLIGREKEEEGDGGTPGESESEAQSILDLTGILGYRWVTAGGWIFRLALTPFLTLSGDYPDANFLPSGGFSVGRVF